MRQHYQSRCDKAEKLPSERFFNLFNIRKSTSPLSHGPLQLTHSQTNEHPGTRTTLLLLLLLLRLCKLYQRQISHPGWKGVAERRMGLLFCLGFPRSRIRRTLGTLRKRSWLDLRWTGTGPDGTVRRRVVPITQWVGRIFSCLLARVILPCSILVRWWRRLAERASRALGKSYESKRQKDKWQIINLKSFIIRSHTGTTLVRLSSSSSTGWLADWLLTSSFVLFSSIFRPMI